MNIEEIVKQEVIKALLNVPSGPSVDRQAVARITSDLAMIPIRQAKGEDVSALVASLKAESAMLGASMSIRAQLAAQEAWMNTITRIATIALITVL